MQIYKLAKSGKWWLPSKPEKKFYGELNFNQTEGGTLLLSDTFDNLWGFPHDNRDFLLLGNLTDETKEPRISVIISLMIRYQEKGDSISILLRPKYIFLGIHIADQKRIEFDKVFLTFSNLEHWISPIHDLVPERNNGWAYHSPWITVNKECKIQITAHPKTHKEGSKWVRENNIRFIIESLGEKTFENYLDLEGKIRDFLNFVINDGVVLQSFEGFLNEGCDIARCEFLFHSMVKEKMHKITVKSPYLFHYGDESYRLEEILNNWFTFHSKNSFILNSYFGVMYNTESYLPNNFLILFTAVEVYHRTFLDKYSPKKKQKLSRLDNFLKDIDETVLSQTEKKELKELVKQDAQLEAKDRIKEVYEQFQDILPYLSKKIGDKDYFARNIVRYRNDLTHGNKPFTDFDEETLFWQYKDLQLILQLGILSRIGFDDEKIRKIFLLDKIAMTK